MPELSALRRAVSQGAAIPQAIAEQAQAADGVNQKVERWRQLRASRWGMPAELLDLLEEPGVTDVLVNGTQAWVDAGSGLVPSAWHPRDLDAADALARQLAAAAGRRLDDACPIVDGFLGEHVRLHAVLPPLAKPGALISLRVLHTQEFTLHSLEQSGSLPPPGESLLKHLVERGITALISGPTGSGKTTLLGAALSTVPSNQRIVCVEEVAELAPRHPHVVHLQERQENVEGAGSIRLGQLVRAALRMRPDWLVLGECRGAEVRDVLSALNTGHRGFTTIHANRACDVPARLMALGTLAELSRDSVRDHALAAFGCVLQMGRTQDGLRKLTEVGVLDSNSHGELICVSALRACGPLLEPADGLSLLTERIGWQL